MDDYWIIAILLTLIGSTYSKIPANSYNSYLPYAYLDSSLDAYQRAYQPFVAPVNPVVQDTRGIQQHPSYNDLYYLLNYALPQRSYDYTNQRSLYDSYYEPPVTYPYLQKSQPVAYNSEQAGPIDSSYNTPQKLAKSVGFNQLASSSNNTKNNQIKKCCLKKWPSYSDICSHAYDVIGKRKAHDKPPKKEKLLKCCRKKWPSYDDLCMHLYKMHQKAKKEENKVDDLARQLVSPSTREAMLDNLKFFQAYKLTKELSNDVLQELAKNSRLFQCPKGTTLIREGDKGTFFGIVKSGKINAFKKVGKERNIYVGQLKESDFFGELALIKKKLRASTLVCEDPATTVMLINKRSFEDNLSSLPNIKNKQYTSKEKSLPPDTIVPVPDSEEVVLKTLTKLPFLRGILPTTLEKVAKNSHIFTASKDTKLIAEGEPPSFFGVILKGSAAITRKGNEKAIELIKPNEFFGERALLEKSKRSSTVKCAEDCRILVIHKTAFEDYLSGLKEIKAKLSKYEKHHKNVHKKTSTTTTSKPESTAVDSTTEVLDDTEEDEENPDTVEANVAFLKTVSLTKNISQDDLETLLTKSTMVHCETGEVVYREGDKANNFYIVAQGKASQTVGDASNIKAKKIKTYEKGEFFGHGSMLKNGVRKSNIICDNPKTRIIEIPEKPFETYLKKILKSLMKNNTDDEYIITTTTTNLPSMEEEDYRQTTSEEMNDEEGGSETNTESEEERSFVRHTTALHKTAKQTTAIPSTTTSPVTTTMKTNKNNIKTTTMVKGDKKASITTTSTSTTTISSTENEDNDRRIDISDTAADSHRTATHTMTTTTTTEKPTLTTTTTQKPEKSKAKRKSHDAIKTRNG